MEPQLTHCQLCKKKSSETFWRRKGLIICKQCFDKLQRLKS
ncbi:hypothetical protein EV03_2257 [Prochlorococcus marinus str. PAC1]|uniref:ClpX-type ZB domain-containing protein n=1 Tax=Prochlorococcus marinus str. PAC1 TaxID=59924 RepID=A0A0A2C2W6_PROMR|nr:hypothetical protein EV03_2257 [Prochlorococcus marinus str. PAC1]